MRKPDFLFEVSWESCNKIGGVHTVLTTKAAAMKQVFGDNYIIIGPDVWKETHSNPNFREDNQLLTSWREIASNEGLNIRIGRSSAAADSITVLVDFTPLFAKKDEILTQLWKKFGLDSLSGQWDYVEPALFGWAAAKVIESYYQFYCTSRHNVIAHFHEWVSGSGVLYLRDRQPLIASVFSAHATVIGRSIAERGWNLYEKLGSYNADLLSHDFGQVAKNSMEKTSANNADVLTVPSSITNRECKQFLGREADIITPNGISKSLLPNDSDLSEMRINARKRILEVASVMTGAEFSNDTFILGSGSRYEFHNKGIDVFLESLAAFKQQYQGTRNVLAVLAVTAPNLGPCDPLQQRLAGKQLAEEDVNPFLTHELTDFDKDPIIRSLKKLGFENKPDDKIKVIFIPAFLDGEDGILNMGFYDLISASDLNVYPSYYEPWGYTPLESLAFGVPAVTSTLSGFGQFVQNHNLKPESGLEIIKRNGDDIPSVQLLVSLYHEYISKDEQQWKGSSLEARNFAANFTWEKLISYFEKAYDLAIAKTLERTPEIRRDALREQQTEIPLPQREKPQWKKVLVKPTVPEALTDLQKLSKNLWWTWNTEAAELFEMINKKRWNEHKFNPISLLESLSTEEWNDLSQNEAFISKLHAVVKKFDTYMAEANHQDPGRIAYFSMEFGLHDTIKIFSGGLGMLAGDHLKEASDLNLNMVGVGLLYRYGYFQQRLSLHGEQISELTPQKFSHLPVEPVRLEDGSWAKVEIALPGRVMYAKIWVANVGRVPLYLFDTDIEENSPADRFVTHQLYGGDLENRLKQELLLGVGGIRMINLLNLRPNIYHCNEGHAAFIGLERLRNFVQNRTLNFMQATEVVRASTLFTTHTPVPAGHDAFPEDLLRAYIPHYAERLGLSWDAFMNLGRFTPYDKNELFSMSVLAVNLSQEVNGVSKIHGRVSREMFARLYDGYFADEVHIGHVTNGVHFPTWTAKSWQKLYKKTFGEQFLKDQSNPEHWKKILDVDDSVIWETRMKQKGQLVEYLKDRMTNDLRRRQEKPQNIFRYTESLNKNALIIGFARRFATYKRAGLLFANPERLAKIVNDPDRPVQFVFAGKAHPHDKNGQALIKMIIDYSKRPEFMGKIFFVENYDIELGKYLVRGVDVWLNTPTRPLEASGTSGEKAVMNGVVNFSVLDGWWAEGYRKDAGWAIDEVRTYEDQELQNELDAEQIFNTFEEEIIPAYFDKDKSSISKNWVSHIKNTIAHIAPHFTMKRQLDDYIDQYYTTLFASSSAMQKDNYAKARVLAAWKRNVYKRWSGISVKELCIPQNTQEPLKLGDLFVSEVHLNMNGLNCEDIGVEVIFGRKENDVVNKIIYKRELEGEKADNGTGIYSCSFPISRAGVYDFTFRVFPKNPGLVHPQEMKLVKWI